jgi:protein tyrosine/serine phosphatase
MTTAEKKRKGKSQLNNRHTVPEMNFRRKSILAAAAVVLVLAAAIASAQDSTNRPTKWAQKLWLPGVANFYQVTTNLYRGAQPTVAGMAQLQSLGVRFVVNLRMLRSDRHELQGTGLKRLNLGMVPWRPSANDVVKFLKAATDTNNLPAFVHCRYGADRTGLMCAMYRIVVCDWTKEEAIAEMRNGGFNFNPGWKTLVSFVEKADVAAYKRRVGLLATATMVARGN